MADRVDRKTLPDLQNKPDTRGKKIERVGISNVFIPLRLQRKDFDDRLPASVLAEVSMYVSVESEARGINMSRLMQTLMVYESQMISSKFIEQILKDMLKRSESNDGYIKIGFKYFIERLAPVSQLRGVHGYDCAFIGRIINGEYDFAIEVNVVGTNCCPCSKEISNYGAHNQRNCIRVRFTPPDINKIFWIEDMIALIEKELSCPIYPLLKREDEKFVTETAYENPKFVEDIARDVSIALDNTKIERYHVKSSADESIHHHQAEAFISKNWNLG